MKLYKIIEKINKTFPTAESSFSKHKVGIYMKLAGKGFRIQKRKYPNNTELVNVLEENGCRLIQTEVSNFITEILNEK